MARKRKGDPVHGWLVVDKPVGLSSSAAVGWARRIFNAAKGGHGGTLDPLASGVLPIAFGEATKTVSFVMDGSKTYRFTVRWGAETTTLDVEGEVCKTDPHRPTKDEILAVLPQFIGQIEQIPPIYSAIKVDGKRAYRLARADAEVVLEPRTVQIEDINLLKYIDKDNCEFEMTCGKGTYVRALARDLAGALGTVGHVVALRRTRVGSFDEKSAILLDKLDALGHSAPLQDHLLSIKTALDDIPALALSEAEAGKLRMGQAVAALPILERSPQTRIEPGTVVCAMCGDVVIALARIVGSELRAQRVLNL